MRSICTPLYVRVVSHSTWIGGKEWALYITRGKDQQMHRNHCLRAAGGAWRNQAVCYCPGIQARAGRSVSVELRMWWEWCTTLRKTPLVGIYIYMLLIYSQIIHNRYRIRAHFFMKCSMIIWFIHGEFNSNHRFTDIRKSTYELCPFGLTKMMVRIFIYICTYIYICDMALLKYSVLLIYDNNGKW